MERRCYRSSICILAGLLALAGGLLCLHRPVLDLSADFPRAAQAAENGAQALPASIVGSQGHRVAQVWPDRSVGVLSAPMEQSMAHADANVLPIGVLRTATGDVVHGRTYLHFPLDVFPPGTDVLRATLYAHVDSASRGGEATLGAYRVLAPWEEGDWSGEPSSWPPLLTSPIGVAEVGLDLVTLPLPTSPPRPTATSTPPPATPTAPTSLLPSPTPPLTASVPPPPMQTGVPVTLTGAVDVWIMWDVTALMRAWLSGEVPNNGLALAAAPYPDADPDTAGNLLVARWRTADDAETRPYLIVEFQVLPVTPTPPPTPTAPVSPLLPLAGHPGAPMGGYAAALLLVGVVLLIVGVVMARKSTYRS